jgi:hypothetical protein
MLPTTNNRVARYHDPLKFLAHRRTTSSDFPGILLADVRHDEQLRDHRLEWHTDA